MIQNLSGRNVLVVEDDYFLAVEVAQALQDAGAVIIGPARSPDVALELIEAGLAIDAAVLDINLDGERAFSVADRLMELKVPFIFSTGYRQQDMPSRYREIRHVQKPAGEDAITRAVWDLLKVA